MLKAKKFPQRMCVGCRTMKFKRELVRVVRTPSGEICLDQTGKKAGRGAYICPNKDCLEKAIKSKALERALQQQINPEIYESLRGQIKDGECQD